MNEGTEYIHNVKRVVEMAAVFRLLKADRVSFMTF